VSAGDPNAFPGIGFNQGPGLLSLIGRNTGLDAVANALQSNVLDKPVVNQTGLTGRYDFALKFTPDAGQIANFGAGTPAAPADHGSVSTYTASQNPGRVTAHGAQGGLGLEERAQAADPSVLKEARLVYAA
jgi:uncharacterized protein (TIGR03435 family)